MLDDQTTKFISAQSNKTQTQTHTQCTHGDCDGGHLNGLATNILSQPVGIIVFFFL